MQTGQSESPSREELAKLGAALRGLAALLGDHPAAYTEIALGIDATLDAHLRRIERLEEQLRDAFHVLGAVSERTKRIERGE
jgi:hypothetical protein